MTSAESTMVLEQTGRVDRALKNPDIARYITDNRSVAQPARNAAELLIREHPDESDERIEATIKRLLPSLRGDPVKVFFSYKAKDSSVAVQISDWLQEWSAGKLDMHHMNRLEGEHLGRPWRQKIEEEISRCDWFLLLLPSPGEDGDERDWVMFEAGFYKRGQDLAGRLVCLHHPQNEMADAIGADETVPAEPQKVKRFLQALLLEPNWLPGLPALNQYARNHLEKSAEAIAELIQEPTVKRCCGPHMEVEWDHASFDNAPAVECWHLLARGRVIESNDDCRRLFGLEVKKDLFGDWFANIKGASQGADWVTELARAVQEVGKGRSAPRVDATFSVGDGRRVRPLICAVRRRKSDGTAKSVDIVFKEAETPAEFLMSPELAAVAVTLQLAVRFRYGFLERFERKKLQAEDIRDVDLVLQQLQKEVNRDPRFPKDLKKLQQRVLSQFDGEDKNVVQHMYERTGQMWTENCDGEMEVAIRNRDAEAVERLIEELLKMNQRFLEVTSRRFADIIATPKLN